LLLDGVGPAELFPHMRIARTRRLRKYWGVTKKRLEHRAGCRYYEFGDDVLFCVARTKCGHWLLLTVLSRHGRSGRRKSVGR
jgi:hypothetical protein